MSSAHMIYRLHKLITIDFQKFKSLWSQKHVVKIGELCICNMLHSYKFCPQIKEHMVKKRVLQFVEIFWIKYNTSSQPITDKNYGMISSKLLMNKYIQEPLEKTTYI